MVKVNMPQSISVAKQTATACQIQWIYQNTLRQDKMLTCFAIPKSRSLAKPVESTGTFSGSSLGSTR